MRFQNYTYLPLRDPCQGTRIKEAKPPLPFVPRLKYDSCDHREAVYRRLCHDRVDFIPLGGADLSGRLALDVTIDQEILERGDKN